jgi:hypothetical protein
MKDFAYAPPGRRAVIVALERTPTGVVQPPVILDAVFNALEGVNLDFSHHDGALAPDRFLNCFAGDPAAIRALGLEKDTVYLVMALNDCTLIEKSKNYQNILIAYVTPTVRIIRVADGKILYSATTTRVQGAGPTEGLALPRGFRFAADAIAEKIRGDLAGIQAALAGGK